ncbi:MAG: aminoacyl-tRNA hydrolase [Ruminiclostridium sp.]|nr:aminoacyl-tRNA hydrolase [Ruminiclostridium sp.]
MFVLVGLGNFGREYERTRHNAGFEAIDYLAALYRIPLTREKFRSILGEGMIQGEKVLLVKPQTYMNNSGEAVRAIMDFYKLEPNKLVVVFDDIDLEPGVIRIRTRGSAGTHNGMRSILYHLGTEEFPRIRIGIGKPDPRFDLADYVLGRLDQSEQKAMNEAVEKVAEAVGILLVSGIETAMGKFNETKKTPPAGA